jgi:chaperone BCS1
LRFANSALQRRLIVSLEISNKDRSYNWVLAWLAQRSSASLAGWTMRSPYLSVETVTRADHAEMISRPQFNIIAGTGAHYFKYQGAWIKVSKPYA